MANQPQTQPDQTQRAMFPPLASLAEASCLDPPGTTDPMVIIGDAADAPSPTSGQGASIAAEDAAILVK